MNRIIKSKNIIINRKKNLIVQDIQKIIKMISLLIKNSKNQRQNPIKKVNFLGVQKSHGILKVKKDYINKNKDKNQYVLHLQ